MRIQVDAKRCTGCHLCEMVCSLFHLRVINPSRSAVRVEKNDLGDSMNTPVLCRQCDGMKCLGKEEVDASIEKKQFIWPRQRAELCPFDALATFEDSAFHCDLCGGDPQCLSVCTTGALAGC
jgi:anaerobic carbon-monoxide dehydrogenase iron sulfur subunit